LTRKIGPTLRRGSPGVRTSTTGSRAARVEIVFDDEQLRAASSAR
jgi:hypothetical protein